MKTIIYLLISIIGLSACNSKNMTEEEIKLINNGPKDTPYRVLLTDNNEDSLLLRQKSIDFDNIENIANDKDLKLFIERLHLTLAEESGVGIAAPQVGLIRNLFLFMRFDKPGLPVQVAINPRIVNHADEMICFERDGCLSVPDISGNTKRYPWIDVEYYDENGNMVKERLSGHSREGDFTGIIFQHEYDHLQGILFIDRLCE